MTEDTPTEDRIPDETTPDEAPRDSDEADPVTHRANGGTAEGRPEEATVGDAAETTADGHETKISDGPDPATEGATDTAAGYGPEAEKARRYLLKGVLGMLALIGFIATIQFYRSASSAITQLVSPEFQPAFEAAFNLVVLLAVGIAIVQVLRRLQ